MTMRRRELIAGLGGAVVAWPIRLMAQQPSKVYRVGYFFSTAPLAVMVGSDPIDPVTKAFVHGLRALGYIEGENLVLERRSAEGKFERIDEIAAELVGLKLDVIVTGSGDFMAQALQRVTRSVPIIVSGSFDPVGAGLVKTLSHPGGNITGFIEYIDAEFESKRLQLLKEAVPNARRVAFLGMKDIWDGPSAQAVRDAAARVGVTVFHVEHTPTNYADAFALMIRDRPDALFVAYHPSNYVNRQRIAEFGIAQQVPTIVPYREATMAGGLMSYGASVTAQYRRVAGLVDKVLKGTKPSAIPVERPTKLELVINLKTAKVLGLDVPATLRALADEVIE
jgi:putative tryptophan/tyrosine transport system substrate-binding protein